MPSTKERKCKRFADLNLRHSSLSNSIDLAKQAIQFGYTDLATSIDFELSYFERIEKADKSALPEPFSLKDIDELNNYAKRFENGTVRYFSRLNVTVDSPDHLYKLRSTGIGKKFDIVAFRPTTMENFEFICTTDVYTPEIIMLDMGDVNTFTLPLHLCSRVISKGIVFELVYANALSDRLQLRCLISRGKYICRSMNSKYLIVSSYAADKSQLRSPYDVLALGTLFNAPENKFRMVLTDTPLQVINSSFTDRKTAFGAFYVDEKVLHELESEEPEAGDIAME